MKNIKRVGLLTILSILMILSIGCKKEELSKAETVVLSVDDSDVYMNEMMYHVMLSQMRGELYASYFKTEDYWDMEYKEGITMREAMKQIAMDDAIKYEILYAMAIKDGYELTQEEEKGCQDKVSSILKNVQKKDLEEDELSEEKLLEIQQKIAICTRYYSDYIKILGVADDATEEEKAEVFDTAFEVIKKQHTIHIKDKVWNKVEVGEKEI